MEQNTVDPCVFMLVGTETGRVRGLLLTHVDDLLLLTDPTLREPVQNKLKELFPVDDWEDDTFSYVGCEYECSPEAVVIKQRNYCETRVDKVTISERRPRRPAGGPGPDRGKPNYHRERILAGEDDPARPAVPGVASPTEAERPDCPRPQGD